MVYGLIYLLGVACVIAAGLWVNRTASSPAERYSGLEIGWASALWPLVILTLITIEVCVRMNRGRS